MNELLLDKIHKEAGQTAILFLKELESSDFIGPTIESIAEIKKINLIYDTINDYEAEGFSATKQNLKFIFVNSNFNLRLQKFTIAHEIYHLDESIAEIKNVLENERAADHFAANILLPEEVVFDKYRSLEKLGYKGIEIFFSLSDLSHVPYETLYKRYKELNLPTTEIDRALTDLKLEGNDPYLKEMEHKLQLLRNKSAIDSSELDHPTYKKYFGKLETLSTYFEQNSMEANNG
ncbi:TPA: ImmA/IrrE family metallo-endopeptidase [Enterococcus faecium]|uniref:ImmA/IrrE family metallo-endopeptidase n=1 Tax=Enterococcus faecium TaxID=1352 RepID=UPI00032E9AF0|nr:ImmA/IrrE family metallo-endopeptidase [Enterococcus faecium]EOG39217.1 hypothetical protein SMS_00643 [Enterococcus faecium EnGen0184]